MMKKLLCIAIVLLATAPAIAQATWNQDIAPIVYDHCGKCHHYGGIAPFSLVGYEEAMDEAEEMLEAILDDEMPPWPADPNYVHHLDENYLTAEEIALITEWVENGTPEGDGIAPEVPTYSDGYALANPDEIISIPYYEVTMEEDEYRTYVVESTSNEDRYIGSIEVEPGNTSIVHHVLFWYDPSNQSQMADEATPEPGFLSTGGAMSSDEAVLIGGWVPGSSMVSWPANLGMKIPGGSDWVIEVHYAPGSTGQTAPLNIRLKYKEDTFIREVFNQAWLYHFPPSLQEGLLIIPANTVQTFHEESVEAPIDLSIISLFPHMHLLGQTFKVYGLTEEGDTIRMVNVNHYDFHWQLNYTFPYLLKLPQGAVIYGEAMYDNTVNNEHNPNDPPQLVTLGEGTTDEMMICFFTFTYYLPGDENMSLSTSVAETPNTSSLLHAWPNPANDKLNIALPGTPLSQIDVTVTDAMGRKCNTYFDVLNRTLHLDVSQLASGCYNVRIESGSEILTSRFVIE